MARRHALALSAALLGTAASAALAAPTEPPAARGARLFRDPKLGTNGKSCASCHQGGARLDAEELAAQPDARLAGYVNSCIEAMLKGAPLPDGSPDLAALVLHVRQLKPKAP